MIYLKGENTTDNSCSADGDVSFKRNFRLAMGVEQREYEGVVQDCKFDDVDGWIPWAEWRHRRIEEDRLKVKPKERRGVMIGVANPTPYEVTVQKKDLSQETFMEHKWLYR
jgi:hypothetical protein